MDAINTAFTPLYQTPVYRDRLVILCDKPSEQRAKDFEKFRKGYPAMEDTGRLVVAPVGSLEEAYPAPWKKAADEVAKLSPRDKTDLADEVGQGVTQQQFETDLAHIFGSLSVAWAKAHQ